MSIRWKVSIIWWKFKDALPSFAVSFVNMSSSQFTNQPHASSPQQWRPQAHHAGHIALDPDAWLVDSGASYHVTSDLINLSFHNPYIESVIIIDGSGLQITRSDTIFLSLLLKLCIMFFISHLFVRIWFPQTNYAFIIKLLWNCFLNDFRWTT